MKLKLLFITFFLFGVGFIKIYSQTEWKVFDTLNSPLPNDRVNRIKQDKQGNFWICTNNGLAKFDGINWKVFTSTNSTLPLVTITDIVFDGSIIWLGTAFDGLIKYDGNTFTTIDFDLIFQNYYQGCNRIQGLDIDKNHNLWIGTANGLVKYNGSQFSRFTTANGLIGPNSMVWSVKCDTVNNIVWVGTYDAGLQKFDGINFTQYHMQVELNYDQINQIMIDKEGDIWVTGYGVVEFDKNTMAKKSIYTSNNGLPDPLVWGIAFDKTNKLWIGSDCLHGVGCLDNGNWIIYNETNSGFPQGTCYWVYDFAVDNDNNILMAHGDKGVIVYRKNGVTVNINDAPLTNDKFAVFPNPANDIIHIDFKHRPDLKMKIYNIVGDCVLQKELTSDTNELDIKYLSKGLYVIIITSAELTIQQKLIKY